MIATTANKPPKETSKTPQRNKKSAPQQSYKRVVCAPILKTLKHITVESEVFFPIFYDTSLFSPNLQFARKLYQNFALDNIKYIFWPTIPRYKDRRPICFVSGPSDNIEILKITAQKLLKALKYHIQSHDLLRQQKNSSNLPKISCISNHSERVLFTFCPET